MVEKTPMERLTELAEGWECAAMAEAAVMAGFETWKADFDADVRSPAVLRYTRVWVEARDNRDRFRKDAAAVRWALERLPAENSAGVSRITRQGNPATDEPLISQSGEDNRASRNQPGCAPKSATSDAEPSGQ